MMIFFSKSDALGGDKEQAERRYSDIVALHVAALAALTNIPIEGGSFEDGKKKVIVDFC